MDMGMMGGGTDYAPLYAQAKEILAAGMLAELKEDADEAMKGEEEDTCPHCGNSMNGPKMGRMGLGAPEMPEMEEPAMPSMPNIAQFAMRMPAAPMAGGAPMVPPAPARMPMPGMGM